MLLLVGGLRSLMAGIVQRLRLPRRLSESLVEQLCDIDAAEIRLANVPAPPISLELKEMSGAAIVPQRGERSYRSPLQ